MTDKSEEAFRTISEAATELDVPQHVLRFWESKFSQIRPMKRAGGRRYYRPADMALLRAVRALLYSDGYTIKGVQRLLREHGAKAIATGEYVRGEPLAADADEADAVAPAVGEAEPARSSRAAPGDRRLLQTALAELAAARRMLAGARET